MNCKGCQNPELQDFNTGSDVEIDDILNHIKKYKYFYNGVVFTGGDPTFQMDALLEMCRKIDLPKILYTGRLYEDLPVNLRELVDIVVDGPYIEDLKTGDFPASSNQRVIRRQICQ